MTTDILTKPTAKTINQKPSYFFANLFSISIKAKKNK